MEKEIIHTAAAPGVVGPYSQAVRAGGFIFTAGQIALDPASGKMVGETIEEQTRRVLDNLKAVLEAAGSGMHKVVKTTVFITDMGHFARMNSVYAEYFPAAPPARSTLPMASLPLGGLVEIECVALA
jgi:2-iminobutanoate/2-iminopropanoate deaminase